MLKRNTEPKLNNEFNLKLSKLIIVTFKNYKKKQISHYELIILSKNQFQ